MPGVIGTDLPIQDNTDMVEDNIKITGVDDSPDDDPYHDKPKIDIDIDSPILPENPKESIDGTVPYETTTKTYETTTKTFEPTIKNLQETA